MFRTVFVSSLLQSIREALVRSQGIADTNIYSDTVRSITATNTMYGVEFLIEHSTGQEQRMLLRNTFEFSMFLSSVERAIQLHASQHVHSINSGATYRIAMVFNTDSPMLEVTFKINDANHSSPIVFRVQ